MDGLSGNDSMWDDVEVDGAVEVDDAEVDDVEELNVESPDEGPPPEGGGI